MLNPAMRGRFPPARRGRKLYHPPIEAMTVSLWNLPQVVGFVGKLESALRFSSWSAMASCAIAAASATVRP